MIAISLVIPTYNEVRNLPLLLEEIWQLIDHAKIDLEFIIVDDNSPDGTGALADELAKQYPVKVIHRAGKLGLGSAVIEGFKISDRPYLGVMDADLSHDPIILNNLILSLIDYDLTLGSRFAAGSVVEKWAWFRKLLSMVGVVLARALTGVQDPLSGYFFFRRSVIEGVLLKTTGYKILLEILVKGHFKKVKELSYTFRIRKYSTSKLNWREFVLFFGQLVGYSCYKIFKSKKYEF
ncbi:MAG: polyprenol monophosphomannose synthase [Candidatus Komeilibacteria bacterium]|nr:polyprenol monophosphomannose synthase [Candidatus Komeilibacteria bacterium]